MSSLDVIDATLLVGIPAAALLVLGLLIRDARNIGRRSEPLPYARALDLILLLFGVAFGLVLVARFLLLT